MATNKQFNAVLEYADKLPDHLVAGYKQKCLDDLRLCTNAPIPDGYHGPELPPYMLPLGVTPSPPRVVKPTVRLISPNDLAVAEQTVTEILDSTESNQIAIARIAKNQNETNVRLADHHVTEIVFPKQNAVLKCFNADIDLSDNNTRITSATPFNAVAFSHNRANHRSVGKTVHMLINCRDNDYSLLDTQDISTSAMSVEHHECWPYRHWYVRDVVKTYDPAANKVRKVENYTVRKTTRPWYDKLGNVHRFGLPFKDLFGYTDTGTVRYRGDVDLVYNR